MAEAFVRPGGARGCARPCFVSLRHGRERRLGLKWLAASQGLPELGTFSGPAKLAGINFGHATLPERSVGAWISSPPPRCSLRHDRLKSRFGFCLSNALIGLASPKRFE